MATEIVTNELPESIAKELRVLEDGKGFITRRGLARLCGVRHNSWGQGGSIFTLKIDEYLASKSVEGGSILSDGGVPDIVAALVIKFYAYRGSTTAQQVDETLSAIGLRAAIQNALGWRPPVRRALSQQEIIELCCLPVPTEWQRRFPEEYYDHLSRLTGLKEFGNSRPTRWAQLTKELVYDWLPEGVYTEVKRCKLETGGYDKLHQFLSGDGLRILEQHQRTLLTLMAASANMQQLKTLLQQSCAGTYQLLLVNT